MLVTDRVRHARQGLAIYFAFLIGGSSLTEWRLICAGDPVGEHPESVLLLMWVPALASMVARIAMREGIHDVSFRLGGKRGLKAILMGWLLPVAVGTVAYGTAWSTGLASFGVSTIGFAVVLVLYLSFMTVVACISAAGEEIGWRGYMLTRLIDAKVPRPVLVSGLIWGAWHLPLILSGVYAAGPYRLLSAVLFVLLALSLSYLWALWRLESGSIWPAVVAHGAWNSVIQGVFDNSTTGATATLWVGESGILVVLTNAVFVAMLIRGKWSMKRAPDERPFRETSALQV